MTIICLLSFTYFADISYCEYISIEELKANIIAESEKYYKALDEYKYADDILRQAKNRPEQNEDIIRYLTSKTNEKYGIYSDYLWNITFTSIKIRETEPTYMFIIKKHYLSEIHNI